MLPNINIYIVHAEEAFGISVPFQKHYPFIFNKRQIELQRVAEGEGISEDRGNII